VVCIAAPLGIGYSRRGVLASVASAVILVFSMNFLTHLFLALGEGDRISPLVPPGRESYFRGDRLYLLYLRATNREGCAFNWPARGVYCPMNPLPNDWAIKHRADACAATNDHSKRGSIFTLYSFGTRMVFAGKI